ncbi:MAG: GspE/PulE family protein [Candidatus Uhrbacteria bacterium]
MDSMALLDYFVRTGKLNSVQVAEIRKSGDDDKNVGQLLLERRLCTEAELLDAQSALLGLSVFSASISDVPRDVIEVLPRALAEHHRALVVARDGRRLTVGLVDPTDSQAVEAIEFFAREKNFSVSYSILPPSVFPMGIRRYEESGRETAAVISEAEAKFAPRAAVEERGDEAMLEHEIARAPVSKIVATITRRAIEANASDIHIEPHGKETRIRYRIDGVLRTILVLPLTLHDALVARVKVLASLQLDETRIPQDGRIHLTEGNHEVDLRVSTLPLLDHEKVVLRVLDTSAKIITLADLGFRPNIISKIEHASHQPHGMILLTGPTGSGKSTTLYAALSTVNREGVNIVTLEDPIEYYIPGVNQAQIRPEVGFTFATGLRAILRQDPNVIMVGEIRDTETAELAIHAGLTGHLLFSTLHTRDVFGVVPRLVDMKVEPFLLASTLILVEAQRLVRRICPDCKVATTVPAAVAAEITKSLERFPAGTVSAALTADGIHLYEGRGCPKCGGQGYRGRTVVTELLEFDDALTQLIVRGFPITEVEALTRERGMLMLQQDALLKALEGETTYEEVLRVAHE